MIVLIASLVITIVGLLAGALLLLASNKLEVKDSKSELVEEIESKLPRYNCGACGYPNCKELAKAYLDKNVSDLKACKVIKQEDLKDLQEYLKEKEI